MCKRAIPRFNHRAVSQEDHTFPFSNSADPGDLRLHALQRLAKFRLRESSRKKKFLFLPAEEAVIVGSRAAGPGELLHARP